MKQLIDKLKFPIAFLIVLFVAPLNVSAQSAENAGLSDAHLQEILLWSVMAVEILLLILVISIYIAIRVMVLRTQPQSAIVQESLVGKMMHKLTDAVPVEKEEEVLTDHEYDGIRELDNNLPPWWTALFYATIAFSVVYLVYYHVLEMGPLQEEEYQIQMANAEAALEEVRAAQAEEGGLIDEENIEVISDENTLAAAGRTYMQYCSACHGNEGQGGVGPNLTDNYWVHGGSVQDIYNTIKYGVPEKGMIAWQGQLSPEQMQGISSYIVESLVGTNPSNPKEPQGELYEPQGEEMSMN